MKLATFNINNVNRRLPNLLSWLKEAKPNVVCLQELKCTDDAFPVDALAKGGYRSVWHGQRTWNGVAILSRGSEPVVTPPPSPAIRRAKKQDSFAVQSAASQIPCGPLLTQSGRKVGPAMVL